MGYDWLVEGSIELRPPVPLARLTELLGQAAFHGKCQVAPLGLAEPELAELVTRARWVLVPHAEAGTDSEGGPQAVEYLRVQDPGVESPEVDARLEGLSTVMGADHVFVGRLRYWGDAGGEDGEIVPPANGKSPSWIQIGGRFW
ncbi:hypothetical protein [Streptomyces sp. NBC_01334]|uniref:hypothetical protein n=1 Tax=Streptomyces sp. NBC_01334 TaxID=2903827 RepID=UPI002E1111D8|nr:hypothetical protein OG736_42090 [Streptomyces sp. NBC_01334]